MRYASVNDVRVRRRILPTRIVKTFGRVENAEALLRDVPSAAFLAVCHGCKLISTETEKAAVLLDFGAEFCGTIRMTVEGLKDARALHVRFGESVMEALAPLGYQGACNDHAPRDQKIDLAWLSTIETNESGFRFAYIELQERGEIEFSAVQGVEILRPVEQRGRFECSDARLNEIYQTAARTTHLCMQDGLWDGIKRDRLVWMGDMHTEVLSILNLYGGDAIVPQSLDFLKSFTKPDEWMNGMPSYSLWWVIVNRDFYLYTGDKNYLEAQRQYLIELIAHISQFVDENGVETIPGKFLDWPSSRDETALHESMQALMKMAFDAASEIFTWLGDAQNAETCRATALRMARNIPAPSNFKGAAAVAVMAGILDPRGTNEARLIPGGAKGYSCFMAGYIAEAKALAGDVPNAVSDLRAFYGGMLDLGATSFWEDFSVDWLENAARIDEITPEGKVDVHGQYGDFCYKGYRHSLCHGWSGGPVGFFQRRVLGIVPTEPGFRRVRFRPELCDLSFARGAVPTPFGNIWVSLIRLPDGSIQKELRLPEGVTLEA